MKGRKIIARDRTTVGRATGDLVCRISVPSKGESYDVRPLTRNWTLAVEKMRKFVLSHLPESPELLEDATFTIYAEVRASSGAIRRKVLAKWTFGDELTPVFETAAQAWKCFEVEPDGTSVEVDV